MTEPERTAPSDVPSTTVPSDARRPASPVTASAGAADDTSRGRRAELERALGALDDAAERTLGRFRGRRGIDVAALVTSNLADYGFVWVVLAAAKGRRPGPARRRALAALALSGFTSLIVNTAVKQSVRRQRPAGAAGPTDGSSLPVRRPSSSSFPSGHTLAAFCTAVVLPEGTCGAAAALGFSAAVGASRVHLRAHHASDVVGGAVIGSVAGLAIRALMPGRRCPGPAPGHRE